ncbi:hypothetical protein [Campylobacter sp. JMF_08 NE1]|nr:hypothetical protein [Campylobacter sp. JMF_08 NE1]MDA3047571.1 hypothetical protein [Campylobacter sp. JMF_08 NE1]
MENVALGLLCVFIIIGLISWVGKRFFDLPTGWSILGFLVLLGGCSE